MQSTRPRWIGALALAMTCAEAATAARRPRSGILAPAPVAVVDHFTDAEITRARRFGRPQLALGGLAAAVEAGVLVRAARRPPAVLDRLAGRPLVGSALTGAGLSLAVTTAALPVSAAMRRRALTAGLATQSWGGWGRDLVKSSAIAATLAGGAATLGVELMRRFGDRWWLPGGVAAAGLAAGLTFAGPIVLDPLFNQFTPLADAGLADEVRALAGAAGLRVETVLQVDASRRTSAANAYVNGLGATKRVVLYDTLLEQFTREEARLVVAHELAHVRHRDVPGNLVQLGLVAPLALRAADRIGRRVDGSAGAPPSPARLAGVAFGLAVAGGALAPAMNRLSRAIERRADTFALELTGAPEAFTSFVRRIVRANLADPDPPALLTALLATHPTPIERIGIAAASATAR